MVIFSALFIIEEMEDIIVYFQFHILYVLNKHVKGIASEMDLAEIRLIRKVVIKERGTAVFQKNPPAPHPLRALLTLIKMALLAPRCRMA